MPTNPQEFADLLGAKIVGEAPEVSGGPFGMAQLAHLMHQRLTPSEGERPGRPTGSTWTSTPERRVSPMQVAPQLLEEAVGQVPVKSGAPVEESERVPEDLTNGAGEKLEPQVRRRRSKT